MGAELAVAADALTLQLGRRTNFGNCRGHAARSISGRIKSRSISSSMLKFSTAQDAWPMAPANPPFSAPPNPAYCIQQAECQKYFRNAEVRPASRNSLQH